MGIFKKDKAVYYQRMNKLSQVTITADTVKLQIDYSNIDMVIEDVPKLLADVIHIYSMVKPELDKKSEEAQQRLADGESKPQDRDNDKPIDLSEIPF